jgi:dual specificity tyrosine-phosphorylation-regulated kinase 1
VGKGVCNNGWDDEHYDYIIEREEVLQDRYLLKNRIGKGSFGQVVRGIDRATGREVAVKIIKSRKPFMLQAKTEVELLEALRQKDKNDEFNLVRLQDHFVHRGHQCLVFEMLSYNLYDLLKYTKFAGVSLTLLRKFTKQILKALQFLARPDVDIIHCDLKPENILLRHPKRSGIKVIDFGSSCRSHKRMYSYIQSRFYRSPEVMLGLPYSVAIDMWSLGCVLVEMHTGEPLFGGVDQHDQMRRLVELLGLPPSEMLASAPAASRDNFFELASSPSSLPSSSSTWRLKPPAPGTSPTTSSSATPSSLPPSASPNAKLADILGVTTGGPSGRRANDPGHALPHYQAFLDLILKMLHFDPALRITPTEALRHPFLLAGGEGGPGVGGGAGVTTGKTEGVGKEGGAQQPRSPRVTATTASGAHHGPPIPLLAPALDAGTQT